MLSKINTGKQNSDDYDEKYMKIRFNSDTDLPLKELKIYDIMIVIRSVFNDNNKYYPQIHLDEFLYKLTE